MIFDIPDENVPFFIAGLEALNRSAGNSLETSMGIIRSYSLMQEQAKSQGLHATGNAPEGGDDIEQKVEADKITKRRGRRSKAQANGSAQAKA